MRVLVRLDKAEYDGKPSVDRRAENEGSGKLAIGLYDSEVLDEVSHGSSDKGGKVGSGIEDTDPYKLSASVTVDGPSHQYGCGIAGKTAKSKSACYSNSQNLG